MGIKGLHQFLKKKFPQVYQMIHISDYQYTRVAIDISLYMFKYKVTFREKWLSAFINLIACLRENEVHAVFIYDGKAPPEKEAEKKNRASQREKMEERVNELEQALENYHLNGEVAKVLLDLSKARDLSTSLLLKQQVSINIPRVEDEVRKMKNQIVTLTPEDFQLSRDLFDILGVPYMQAPSEAETYCSHLCVRGHASAVMSEDSDVLAYGTPAFLTKINTGQGVCEFICYQNVLKELDLTQAQFTDFCIMCGTDYNSNIFRIGPDKAYKLIKKHGSIEGVEQAGYDISILNHHRVRELFSVPDELEVHIPYCGRPDFEKLEEFLTVNNCKYDLAKLKKACEPIELIFEEEKES